MELFTLNRKFLQRDQIDVFRSIIWTERYYGDSEIELNVPLTVDSLNKLSIGTFLGIPESDEIMILESMQIEEKNVKFTGISLLSWMNNRFIRLSHRQQDQSGILPAAVPGKLLWDVLAAACHSDSPYLTNAVDIGITNPERFIIPGLELKDYDRSGAQISPPISFGPVYDVMRKDIADPYGIGMQLTLESATDSAYILGFRSYKGLDHTSGQTVNPIVRFSPQMDSLTEIEEFQSIAALKTEVYMFASNNPGDILGGGTPPGTASLTGPQYTGFDLRVLQDWTSDITEEMIETVTDDLPAGLLSLLNAKATVQLNLNSFVENVDGQIVPTSQFQYGRDFNLGDFIEIQGNSNIISVGQVTEYIRSQDEAGEKSYPTITMLH